MGWQDMPVPWTSIFLYLAMLPYKQQQDHAWLTILCNESQNF